MRGYQRRVVLLKNIGSALFEEAYFVMRSDEAAEGKTEKDMICEADRIIRENADKKTGINKRQLITIAVSFFLGALTTFLLALFG